MKLAEGIAWAAGKPIVGVDHLVGHLLSVYLVRPDAPAEPPPSLPFVALLVSGGHTALYRVDALDPSGIRELGATRDDAAGEAFDKVAKLMGLGYPGGPVIDRLARRGDPKAVDVAPPMPRRDSLEFSFSGIKTNVARWVERNGVPTTEQAAANVCAAFQKRVVDVLVEKAVLAVHKEGVRALVLGGGVAANRELRERALSACTPREIRLVVPPLASCTDNAAMIAYAGSLRLARGANDAGRLEMSPRTILPRVTCKGRGRRN